MVTTRPGKGTVFEVFFPVAGPKVEPAPPLPRSNPQGVESILLIDDEKLAADPVRAALESFGFRVTAFSDGPLALNHFLADPGQFDLVVTDLYMPKLNGKQIAMEMRKAIPGIPIILCTGDGAASVGSSESGGMYTVLYKPFTPDELGHAIREILDGAVTHPMDNHEPNVVD